MDRYGRSALGREAAAAIPSGDPAFVESTSIPFMKARQDRHRAWLAARPDRFSQILASGAESEVVGARLHTSGVLSDEARVEMLGLRRETATLVKKEIQQVIQELRGLIASRDALLLVAHLTNRHILVTAGDYYEPSHEGSEVAVEIAAGLSLTQAPVNLEAPTALELESVNSRLQEVIHLSTYAAMIDQDPDDLDSQLRAHALGQWLNVRGEAYQHHARDLAIDMYRPLEPWFSSDFGFTIDQFLTFSDGLLNAVEERVNQAFALGVEHFRALGETAQPLNEEEHANFKAYLEEFWQGTAAAATFKENELIAVSSLSPEVVRSILKVLTVELGELEQGAYSGPFDPSPLVERPLLRSHGRYLLPVPGHLVRAPHRIFDRRLQQRHNAYSAKRASALDEHALQWLRHALPGTEGTASLYYRFDEGSGLERYETDGLLIFEDRTIVVEGKAQSLSVAALRGDLLRLGRDMRDHLASAAKQCDRVAAYLDSDATVEFEDRRGRSIMTVPAEKSRQKVFVCPLLYPLGVYALELPQLARLGAVGSDLAIWPVLVTDLRVICEMVRSPAELLHYLEWRLSLRIGERAMAMDELDIFAAYLFGHVGHEEVPEDAVLSFGPATADFDAYYSGVIGQGQRRDRPRRIMGDVIEGELERLSMERPRGWLDTSFALLDLSIQEAAAVEARSSAGRRLPRDGGFAEVHGETLLVVVGPEANLLEVLAEASRSAPKVRRRVVATVRKQDVRLSARRLATTPH